MKKIIISLILILLFISLYQPSYGGNSISITVNAVVLPRITQSIIRQETKIHIKEEDIERGFVEVPSGTILEVKTNHRNGYMLFFQIGNEVFKEILVMEGGRTISLSSNGGLVHQPYSGSNLEIKNLSYRLYLREGIKPGFYSWPLSVKATLL